MYEIVVLLGEQDTAGGIGFISIVLGCAIATAVFMLLVNPVHNFVKYYIAHRLGDPDIEEERLLNLRAEGSFSWLCVLFTFVLQMGFAMPVIFDRDRFKKPYRGTLMVASAGVVTYFLAALSFFILYVLSRYFRVFGVITATMPPVNAPFYMYIGQTIYSSVYFLSRICFNSFIISLLPLVPFDMGDVLYMMFKGRYVDILRNNQFLISIIAVVAIFLIAGRPDGYIEEMSNNLMYDIIVRCYNILDFITGKAV